MFGARGTLNNPAATGPLRIYFRLFRCSRLLENLIIPLVRGSKSVLLLRVSVICSGHFNNVFRPRQRGGDFGRKLNLKQSRCFIIPSDPGAAMDAERFQELSVARTLAVEHPRWRELKDHANQALKDGNVDAAIEGYTCALMLAEGNIDLLFDVLSARPPESAGARLAAARQDYAPLIRQFIPVPNAARGEPNDAAAICLANRASAYLKLGLADAAVVDARAATLACPEYVKGHFRLRQALIAAGDSDGRRKLVQATSWEAGAPTAEAIQVEMRRFEILSEAMPRDRQGLQPPGIWLGFRLVICNWLDPAVYFPVYEDARAGLWRDVAHRVMANQPIATWPPDECPYDYRYLRVHTEVFHNRDACPLCQSDYLTVGMNTLPTRPCLFASGARPAQPRMANFLGEMPRPPLPSIDYRHIRLPAKLPETPDRETHAATGRMIATALSEMFAKDGGLTMVTMLGLGHPLHVYADTVRDHFEAAGLLRPTPGRELDALVVLYAGGCCIQHRKFGYRGVIVGTPDHTCMQDERWIATMGVDDLPRGRYQPWYHVLVDVRDRAPAQRTYVCHENIRLWLDVPDDEGGGPLGPIDHPDVRRAFTGYDRADRRYVMPNVPY